MRKQYVFVCVCFEACLVWGEITLVPSIDSNCTELRDIFANAAADFIKCSIDFSKPISFCENCVDQYIDVLDTYKNMSQVAVNGTSCIDYFVNLDRLGIVQTLYDNNVNLWIRAKCYECYVIVNATQTKNVSHETIMFNSLHKEFIQCVDAIEPQNMCTTCMSKYLHLQDYYQSISNENEKIGVCMDIVDTMNTTWIYWGDNCCKYRRHAEYAFIGSTVAVVVVTMLFYMLAHYCAKQKSPTIIQQSRFAEVLNTLST